MPNNNDFVIKNGVLKKYTGKGENVVTIPNSVTEIGKNAFEGCSSLTEIKIPNDVTTIGDWAFLGCSSLTEIEIPNSVTEIGDSAFKDCSSLKNITIPDSVKTIGKNIFKKCDKLEKVIAPAGFIDTLPERLKKQVTFTVCNEKKQKYTILNSCYIG